MGAATLLMGEVWGSPTMKLRFTGETTHATFEIAKPFSIVVDNQGSRFFAESKPSGDAVRSMYAKGGRRAQDRRAWLVLDHNYRNRYTLGGTYPWTDVTRSSRTEIRS